MTGIIAFNSFGNDLRMMQMYKALHLKTATVLWSKYLGLCMLGLIQALFVFRADVDFPGELSGLFKDGCRDLKLDCDVLFSGHYFSA